MEQRFFSASSTPLVDRDHDRWATVGSASNDEGTVKASDAFQNVMFMAGRRPTAGNVIGAALRTFAFLRLFGTLRDDGLFYIITSRF